MTEPNHSHLPEETLISPKKPKPPFWMWLIVGIGFLELLTFLSGLGVYYLCFELPRLHFAQTYQSPWQKHNVNVMAFEHPEDFRRAQHILLDKTQKADTRQDPVPHYLLAELYTATYQTQNAISAYQQVVRLGEQSWYNRLAYRSFSSKAHEALALLYYQKGQHHIALKELNAIGYWSETSKPQLLKALRECMENPERADFRMRLGKELRHDLKLSLATREIKAAERLSHSPKLRLEAANFLKTQMPQTFKDLSPLARYFSLAGKVHQYQHDDLKQAAAYYQLATAEMPNYEWGYNELAIIYRQTQDFKKAISAANQAIALNPNFYNPHLTLGDIALDQEMYKQAIHHFQAAQAIIQRLPSEESLVLVANIENQIGYAYEQLKQVELAAHHYQKAMLTAVDDSDQISTEDYQYAQEGLSRIGEMRHKSRQSIQRSSDRLSWLP